MKESVISFGESVPIFGVLTEPAAEEVNENYPTVVLVNAGLLGRIGPFRLHVIIARRLAKLGLKTVRLDLSGIGESGRHRDNRPRLDQHLSDIREALDYLENQEAGQKFVIMGICTGADNAHRAMLDDERVVGAVCVDGYAYPTRKYYVNYYLAKAMSLRSWVNLIKRVLRRSENRSRSEYATSQDDELRYRWSLPPKDKTNADFQDFIGRGVKLLCVYTSSWPYNYTGQLADAFSSVEFGDTISAVYLPNATHTFKVEEDRNALIEAFIPWVTSNWDPAQGTS
jgi:pimeloyl-ACP methyl ester carboxylesterase